MHINTSITTQWLTKTGSNILLNSKQITNFMKYAMPML